MVIQMSEKKKQLHRKLKLLFEIERQFCGGIGQSPLSEKDIKRHISKFFEGKLRIWYDKNFDGLVLSESETPFS